MKTTPSFKLSSLFLATTMAIAALALCVPFRTTRCQRTCLQIRLLGGSYSLHKHSSDWLRNTFGREIPYTYHGKIGPLDQLIEVNLGPQGKSTAPGASRIGNNELDILNGSRHLCSLSLACTPVTDISELEALPALKSLDLTSTPLNQSSIDHLKSFPSLKNLTVRRTGINDSHIKSISLLPRLEILNASTNAITDRSVQYLCRLRELKTLIINNTDISDEGVAMLMSHLPQLEVRHEENEPNWKNAP